MIFLIVGLYPGVYLKFFIVSPSKTTFCQEITTSQANELKELIKQIALQKGIHPNKIHQILKERFNYASYRKMDCETWEKVKNALKKYKE